MQLQSNLEIQTVLKEKVYQIIYFKKTVYKNNQQIKLKKAEAVEV